jgi:hypothetical protein
MSELSTAERVRWADVRAYLEAHGWSSVKTKRDYVAVFRHADPPAEVLVPLDRQLPDYGRAMLQAASEIGRTEARSGDAVIRDLIQPSKDIVRFALVGGSTDTGSVALVDGFSLLGGARKALLASASTARIRRRFHPRLSFAEAENYLPTRLDPSWRPESPSDGERPPPSWLALRKWRQACARTGFSASSMMPRRS